MKTIYVLILLSLCSLVYAEATINVPNSDTSIGFAGKIHLDVLVNSDDMGNKTGFSPATIPVNNNSGNVQTTLSAGQTKFQFMTATPMEGDTLNTLIEWDWYNRDNSSDFHLTQLWAQYKSFGAGQTFSVFMDISTFPNTLEYFGPNSMVFVRQPQIRYTLPLSNEQRFAFAIEQPNSVIEGVDNCVNASACEAYSAIPDFTAHWRMESGKSHIQIAGILRQVGYQFDQDDTESAVGYGVNISGNLQLTDSDLLSAALVYGEGIGRYINDTSLSDTDAVVKANGDVEALPVFGMYAFLDHAWNDATHSSIGYGFLELDNGKDQANDAFKQSNFFVINIIHNMAKSVQIGTELQWGDLEVNDGSDGDNLRWQSSVIYRF